MTSSNPSMLFSPRISHYPIDILQVIFEEAVQANQKGFKLATSISHVCKTWRYAATRTPSLWTYIECPMLADETELVSFWNRMHERSKGLPVIISLLNVRWTLGCVGALRLQFCTMDKFSKITRLTLHLRVVEDLELALDRDFRPPQVDQLEFIFQSRTHSSALLHYIMGIFPPVKRLRLSNTSAISFSSGAIFKQIQHLVLQDWVYATDLMVSLQALHCLKELELITVHDIALPTVINLTSLRRFKLREISNIAQWLFRITCPNLFTLDIDDYVGERIAIPFISRHPSIKELLITDWESIKKLNIAAPQLQYLTFNYASVTSYYGLLIDNMPNVRLSSLRSLTIRDPYATMGSPQFDMLVRTRFLPPDHPQNSLPPSNSPLQYLVIQVPSRTMPEKTDWSTSEFYRAAKRRIQHDDENNCWCITLSWI